MPSLLSGIGRFLTGTKPWRDAALRQRRDATSKHTDPSHDCATYYQCAICLEMACEPAVTKCGHLFCWRCFASWMRSTKGLHWAKQHCAFQCPTCKVAGVAHRDIIFLFTETPRADRRDVGGAGTMLLGLLSGGGSMEAEMTELEEEEENRQLAAAVLVEMKETRTSFSTYVRHLFDESEYPGNVPRRNVLPSVSPQMTMHEERQQTKKDRLFLKHLAQKEKQGPTLKDTLRILTALLHLLSILPLCYRLYIRPDEV